MADPRINYETRQIDRATLDDIRGALGEEEGEG